MSLLTESAKFDPGIVNKIQEQLRRGGEVCITSGLYKALQGKGIEEIVELTVTDRKASVSQFRVGWGWPMAAEQEMIIPQISYLTNDSWEVISALDDSNGWPVLHRADYSGGQLFVLTVPDNFIDFHNMPDDVLNRIRQDLAGSLDIVLEGPGEVSLFLYDNGSFVIESFLDEKVSVNVLVDPGINALGDLLSGQRITGTERIAPEFMGMKFGKDLAVFEVEIMPHSFRAFNFID